MELQKNQPKKLASYLWPVTCGVGAGDPRFVISLQNCLTF